MVAYLSNTMVLYLLGVLTDIFTPHNFLWSEYYASLISQIGKLKPGHRDSKWWNQDWNPCLELQRLVLDPSSSCQCFWTHIHLWHLTLWHYLHFPTRAPPGTGTEPRTILPSIPCGREPVFSLASEPPMVTWASASSFQKIPCVTGCPSPSSLDLWSWARSGCWQHVLLPW